MEIYPSHVVVSWIGHSEKVARLHYLQTTDAHFEKAVIPKPAELVASSKPETVAEPSDLVAIQVASETREMVKTDKPVKAQTPVKTNVLRGSADAFATNSYPVGTRTTGVSSANSALSEIPGAQAGAIETENDSQGQLRQQALDDLQRAWKALRRLETLSDDAAESKAAGKAVAFVDKAFRELEGGKR